MMKTLRRSSSLSDSPPFLLKGSLSFPSIVESVVGFNVGYFFRVRGPRGTGYIFAEGRIEDGRPRGHRPTLRSQRSSIRCVNECPSMKYILSDLYDNICRPLVVHRLIPHHAFVDYYLIV